MLRHVLLIPCYSQTRFVDPMIFSDAFCCISLHAISFQTISQFSFLTTCILFYMHFNIQGHLWKSVPSYLTRFWICFGWLWSTLVSYSNSEDALAGLFLEGDALLVVYFGRSWAANYFQGPPFGTIRLRMSEISMAYYHTIG